MAGLENIIDQIRQEAENAARLTRETAEGEAAKILEEAREKAARIEEDGRAKAAKETDDIRSRYESMARAATRSRCAWTRPKRPCWRRKRPPTLPCSSARSARVRPRRPGR